MSVLSPKYVAAMEPLLPPRVTGIWQQLLSRTPRKELRMGARMSDWVCSKLPECAHQDLRRGLVLCPLDLCQQKATRKVPGTRSSAIATSTFPSRQLCSLTAWRQTSEP